VKRIEGTNIISLKSRRNKKKYKKLYDLIENIKSTLFSKKNKYSPKDTVYKKPMNN
jgi:hypothetical protein